MLAKYNLHVGYTYNRQVVTALEKPTGVQSEKAKGWFSGFTATNPVIGSIFFVQNDNYYWQDTVSSYPAYVYNENSYIYDYLENYKTTLINSNVAISNIRLIDLEELIELGCDTTSNTCNNSKHSWLYSTSYWTGNAGTSNSVWNVMTDGSLNENLVIKEFGEGDVIHTETLEAMSYGARPVIEMPVAQIYIPPKN